MVVGFCIEVHDASEKGMYECKWRRRSRLVGDDAVFEFLWHGCGEAVLEQFGQHCRVEEARRRHGTVLMVDGADDRLDRHAAHLEQTRLARAHLTVRNGWRPAHDALERETAPHLVAESVGGEDRVHGGGRFEQMVDVRARSAGRETLQARMEEERGEELERSAADEGEPAVVALSRVEVRLVRDGAQREIGVGVQKTRRPAGEMRKNIGSSDACSECRRWARVGAAERGAR